MMLDRLDNKTWALTISRAWPYRNPSHGVDGTVGAGRTDVFRGCGGGTQAVWHPRAPGAAKRDVTMASPERHSPSLRSALEKAASRNVLRRGLLERPDKPCDTARVRGPCAFSHKLRRCPGFTKMSLRHPFSATAEHCKAVLWPEIAIHTNTRICTAEMRLCPDFIF